MSAPLMHCRYFLERDADQPHLVHISVHIASSPFAGQVLPEGHQQLLQHIAHLLIGFAAPAASTKPGCLLTVDADLTALTEQDSATQASSIACLASLHATAASWQIRCDCVSALSGQWQKALAAAYLSVTAAPVCVSLWGQRLVVPLALALLRLVPLRRAACAASVFMAACRGLPMQQGHPGTQLQFSQLSGDPSSSTPYCSARIHTFAAGASWQPSAPHQHSQQWSPLGQCMLSTAALSSPSLCSLGQTMSSWSTPSGCPLGPAGRTLHASCRWAGTATA